MSRYKIRRYKDCEYLSHEDRKKHKYVAKIKLGKNKYRYFYTKKEYDAYLHKKKAVGDISNKAKSIVDNIGDKIKKASDFVNSKKNRNISGLGIFYTRKQFENAVNWVINLFKKDVPEKDSDKDSEKEDKQHKYVEKVKLPNGKYRYFYDVDSYNAYKRRLEYQANEPEFLKKLPKIDPNKILSADENMAEINEDYDKYDDKRSQNCAYCTSAYELRMRGYDVQAAEYNAFTYNATPATIYSWYKNGDMKLISPTDEKGSTTIKSINKYLSSNFIWDLYPMNKELESDDSRPYIGSDVRMALEANNPPGSRGQFVVSWKSGGGHSMVYEIDSKGHSTIRDCQVNETYTVEEIISYGVSDVMFMRTDNLELNEKILKTVERN